MNIEIANRLVTLRKQFNFSQEDLAERLGISRQAVSRWERAEASPDTDNLINLSKIYGVSIDSLLALDADGEENLAFQTRENTADDFQSAGASGMGYTIAPSAPKNDDLESFWKLLRRISPVYPVIVVLVYLLLGIFLDWWHPGWLVFLTIPIFYTLIAKK